VSTKCREKTETGWVLFVLRLEALTENNRSYDFLSFFYLFILIAKSPKTFLSMEHLRKQTGGCSALSGDYFYRWINPDLVLL